MIHILYERSVHESASSERVTNIFLQWEIKKKKIIDGVVRPYDWQRWERNQENLKQQKAVRQEKRERKRAQSKATKKKGQWITPRKYRRGREGKRSRSQSDDTYSEDEEPIERPPKRQVIIDSDSDDDIPLASLIRTKAVSGITSSIPTGLVGAFSLPIRSSQSPFPRETAKVGLQKSVENIGLANTLITSSSSQRNGKLAAPGTLQSTGKTAASKAANEAAIPGPKLIIETKDISTQNPVPQVRATAIRSSIPKSQNVFNIPKRVNMAKGKAPPRAGNLESPTVKDFYSHIARHWKHAPRDRDNRRPDTSNMTLMSISAAAESTSVPAYKRGSISIPETDLTLIESGMNVPSARSDKIDLGTSMFNRGTSAGNPAGYVVEKSNFSRETALDQPFIEGSPHEEDSLFVTDGQDVTMRDVGVGASLPISDPADAELTRSSGRQIDKPKRWSNPTPVNHSAAMSSTQASNKPVLTARASIDQLPNSTNVTVSSRNAKETGAKGSAQAISSRIDLNRVRAVLVGNLESLDLEAGNRGYERLCDPTYIQLALPHTQLLCVQIKNFKTVEHHQLLQHDAPQNLRRVFHLREKYATFEDFLSKQEHKVC